jgi:hypothetical protein
MSQDLSSLRAGPRSQVAATDATDPELLSAWVDGELDRAQAGRMMERLRVDAGLQADWLAHHVVSDALKSNDVACHASAALRERICEALAAEPSIVAPRRRPAMPARWLIPVAGGVAAVVFLAVGMTRALNDRAPTVAVSVPLEAGPAGGARKSPRDPVQLSGVPQMQRDPRLEAYLRAHRELGDSGVLPQAVMYLRAGED